MSTPFSDGVMKNLKVFYFFQKNNQIMTDLQYVFQRVKLDSSILKDNLNMRSFDTLLSNKQKVQIALLF